ncbi:hypothetical protein D9611_007176 [Ephemerocybe angulata]|uniref:Uncharacterized protein n=1 Tax=Ephemerocybe angulata TaxID=980116 RepID=A0A8H5B1B8_9AGAR|nr:hypothetical protein D9611_007176 [Tulosesus angulatus]
MEVRVSARRLEAYPLGRGGELCGGRPRDVEGWGQVFDLWLVGSGGRIVDLWEDFGDSVVRRVTRPSEIVQRAVERNTHLFLQFTEFGSRKARDPFSKVLAVHIRRGDYEGHCVRLAKGNASFYGWSQLPWPPDRFKIDVGENGHEEGEYMKHCLPDVERIIGKIHATRDEWEKETVDLRAGHIDTLYILTNAHPEWVQDLKSRIYDKGRGWKVVTSHDLVFSDSQEKDVGMTIDMDLARRAAVFVGNGWSSLTSNVVHRRLT